jgi:hypothetical protein
MATRAARPVPLNRRNLWRVPPRTGTREEVALSEPVATRFWFPRGQSIAIDEEGFLLDPEHDFLRHANPDAARLSALREFPCGIVLGESGLGKSTDLCAEARALVASGERVHAADLGLVGTEESLVREVFTGAAWEEWRKGSSLTLHLDALDECRVSVEHAAQVLFRELRRLGSVDRLRLRIACRPGAWPEYLEQRLTELWPNAVTVFSLAPLRRSDAEAIAHSLGVSEPVAFFEAVRAAGAAPLASSPLTLRLLARLYRERGSLPSRRFELYETGTLALCTEENPSRRASGKVGELSGPQRLAVAGRLAALTVLCGKTGIWLGGEVARPGSEWLAVPEAAGGAERAADQDFSATERAVREVLEDTALLAAVGPERLRWAHQSYAEFLAARHLLVHEVPLGQLRQLLWHPAKPKRIVPQLLGVVGWLGRSPGLFQVVCDTDPQALFRSDLTEGDDDDRRRAVDAVMRAVEEGQLDDTEFDEVQYRRLGHAGLANQLRPVIANKGASRPARCLAIDLARACCPTEVQSELVTVALDATDTAMIRGQAASTLCRLEDPAARASLRPLLDRPLDEDLDDDLKGYALRAVWPQSLTAAELFAKLTPPKNPHYLGAYSGFIDEQLLPGLGEEDLPTALCWTAGLSQDVSSRRPFKGLCSGLFQRAWDSPRFSSLVTDLARAVWANIDRHERGLSRGPHGTDVEGFGEDDEKRRELLAALLLHAPSDQQRLRLLLSFRPRIVKRADVPWLLDTLSRTQDAAPRGALLELLMLLFDPHDATQLEGFIDAASRNADLKARLDPYLSPVELGSETAERLRRDHARNLARERREARREERLSAGPSPRERISAHLDGVEAGTHEAWCDLVRDLSATPTSRIGVDALESDLTSLPGWQGADDATRGRIRSAAEAFVRAASPRVDDWFEEDRHPTEVARAGFKALRFLRQEERPAFDRLEDAIWERWLPALLAYPSSGHRENEQAQQELLAIAYRKRPEQLVSWLRRFILRDNGFVDEVMERTDDGKETTVQHETPTRVLRRVSGCFDETIARALRPLLSDPAINATIHGNLLEFLLARGDDEAIRHARAILSQGVPTDEPGRRRHLGTLLILMERLPAEAWPVLQSLSGTHPDIFRTLLGRLANSSPSETALRLNLQMPEHQVAELYQALTTTFFPSAAAGSGTGDGEAPYRLKAFCSEILRHLCDRGTFDAVAALDELGETMPEMNYARIEAERRALEDIWDPPEPGEFLALLADNERRLVRSGEELLGAIRESLGRLERELQGETRLNFILWDERENGVFRPKDEERLSDVIKQHLMRDLKDRGLLAHREVQIRSKQGKQGVPGEETDIDVDVLVRLPGRKQMLHIRVTVEVKGCWHNEVLTAMENQLRDRYLRDTDCRHGLYLVGRFLCPQWDKADHREARARSLMPGTMAAAQALFESQARQLSGEGVVLQARVLNGALR